MSYEQIKDLKPSDFKRLCGVQPETFKHMVEMARTSEQNKRSGKRKRHTFKSQVVVDLSTKQIICTAHGKGKQHDFKLFKASRL